MRCVILFFQRDINELIDLVAACNAGVVPRSNEVAAVSVSGGGAVMISDAAAEEGLELSDYDPEALAELKAANSFVNDRNPIDISAPSMSNMAITGGHLKWGTEQDAATMLGYISHIPLVPRTRPDILPQLLDPPKNKPGKLVAIAGNFHSEDRKDLVQAGVAVFDDPTVATRAVAKLVKAGKAFDRAAETPQAPGPITDKVRETLQKAGIQLVAESVVSSVEEAQAALDVHKEIVLKLTAPTLQHRTELGGVFTELSDPDAVVSACDITRGFETKWLVGASERFRGEGGPIVV